MTAMRRRDKMMRACDNKMQRIRQNVHVILKTELHLSYKYFSLEISFFESAKTIYFFINLHSTSFDAILISCYNLMYI